MSDTNSLWFCRKNTAESNQKFYIDWRIIGLQCTIFLIMDIKLYCWSCRFTCFSYIFCRVRFVEMQYLVLLWPLSEAFWIRKIILVVVVLSSSLTVFQIIALCFYQVQIELKFYAPKIFLWNNKVLLAEAQVEVICHSHFKIS